MALFFEDLAPGMSAEAIHEVSEEDVRAFAAVSGDDNPIHLDEGYAEKTPFKTRIAHGILTASYISALIGTRLPGPGAVYVSQTLYFKRPVKLGDSVRARVEITALDRGKVTFACHCSVNGKTVLEGEAVALAPRRPAAAA
ncbi:MAG: MaoC family dehydratase [Hyphomonadaceae bacterium]